MTYRLISYFLVACSLCVFNFGSLHAVAETPVVSGNNIVAEAVMPRIVVAVTPYNLRNNETGSVHGRDNLPFFNRMATVGVLTDEGIEFSDAVLHPETYDPRYNNYREGYTAETHDSIEIYFSDGNYLSLPKGRFVEDQSTAVPTVRVKKPGLYQSDPIDSIEHNPKFDHLYLAVIDGASGPEMTGEVVFNCRVIDVTDFDPKKSYKEFYKPSTIGAVCFKAFLTKGGSIGFRKIGMTGLEILDEPDDESEPTGNIQDLEKQEQRDQDTKNLNKNNNSGVGVSTHSI